MCIRKKTDIIEVVAVSISWLHILKIKDSSFIYTPEGMYFSERLAYNDNYWHSSINKYKNYYVEKKEYVLYISMNFKI